MDLSSTQILIPLGVITAALIAGFFSFLNLIISKEQKVSEFRQQWIDSLRQELAEHIAATVSLTSLSEGTVSEDLEREKNARIARERVVTTYSSIRLRINPNDSNEKIKKLNTKVLYLLANGRNLFNESKWREARLNCNEITEASIPMLKEEWVRVKKGEAGYVWSKRIAISLFALSLLSLTYAGCVFFSSKSTLLVSYQSEGNSISNLKSEAECKQTKTNQ